MTLIKSISGIRGTIGAGVREGLNPISTAQFTAAYAQFIRKHSGKARPRIVVGRDARMSGSMVKQIVVGTLMGMGCDVVDIDLATTPTTEMAVVGKQADGGIILTASHNPKQWNALKLLNEHGEFISDSEGKEILRLAESDELTFAEVDGLGCVEHSSYLKEHIDAVLKATGVDVEAIRKARFAVTFDSVNSVGGIALPALLEALGVETIHPLYDEPTGNFAHNPEPLPEHLTAISAAIREQGAHVGFVVDPDVDRLAIIDERGECFGEEYTLVAIADYLLGLAGGGNTVSNLSSTRALRDVTLKHG
ncbi:MAG: phosphoglucosamine mutase, partial [Porphyromonadaceae bacterium]|nr:phosphoglucosamine mutase [Porphyromonadaceae bacterium]